MKGDGYVGGDEIEVVEWDVESWGIEMLMGGGDVKVKKEEEKREGVKGGVRKGKKGRGSEGKRKKEVEEGGEF